MSKTIRSYTSDGAQVLYPIDFVNGFIKREYVYVYLDTEDYTTQLTYTWISDSQIQLTSPVANGLQFHIRRVIPRDDAVNDYQDGAILKEKNLDDSYNQALMILEEVEDGYVTGPLNTLQEELDALTPSIVEPVVTQLSAGQLTVTTSVDASTGVFYVTENNTSGESKRLTKDIDYSVVNGATITLTNSYPADSNFIQTGSALLQRNASTNYFNSVDYGAIEVIAHRGFRDTGFQNTLLSLTYAQRLGADSLEVDASISSDGSWYLFHDATLDSLTDGTGNFVDNSAATINSLRYNSGVGTDYDALRITKLDDFLSYIREAGIKAYIELKQLRNSTTDVTSLLSIIDSYGLLPYVNIQSFVKDQISYARAAYPSADLSLLRSTNDHAQAVADGLEVGANMIIGNYTDFTSKADADLYYEAGLNLAVYTVDKAEDYRTMASYGIRKIITDRSAFK